MEKKILVSSIKDAEDVKIYTGMEDKVDWKNLEENIKQSLEDGQKVVTVKFFLKTKKWLDNLPEYEG